MNTAIPLTALPAQKGIFRHIRKDALAGIITGMMAVPSTIGICLLSEYPIQAGLVTVVAACIISFITFLFRPGNFNGVPGVAAGLAPLLALGIHSFGMENMPFLIFLTAFFQALVWRFNWQRYVQKVIPAYLVEGLLAGIGLKVIAKFLPFTFATKTASNVWLSNDRLIILGASFITLVVFLYLYRKYKSRSPAIPYLTAIGLGVFLALYVPAPMLHVPPFTMKIGLPLPHFHKFTPLLGLEMIGYALMLASVDVIEQVMSNAAIEKLDPANRKTNSRNSLFAIWLSNMVSSFFGGMTNLDGLQMSSTNIIAGAVSKLSNLFTAATITFFLFNYKLLEYLPEFLLGGLMIFVGWKMVIGLFHVAEKGRYPLMLAMICAILVYFYGMFEGLLIVVAVHAFIFSVIEKYKNTSTQEIVSQFIKLFSDSPDHPHQTETMNVSVSKQTGGLSYQSIRRSPVDKKSLENFIKDWGISLSEHSVPRVIGHYDAQAMLWGTFANKLSSGHEEIRHYFEHLLTLSHLKVSFDSCDFRQYGDIYIQSGSYTFSFEKKGKVQNVPARYSFVCKKERTGWYILEHHSSEFPN